MRCSVSVLGLYGVTDNMQGHKFKIIEPMFIISTIYRIRIFFSNISEAHPMLTLHKVFSQSYFAHYCVIVSCGSFLASREIMCIICIRCFHPAFIPEKLVIFHSII